MDEDGGSQSAWPEKAEEELPQKCSRSLDKAHKQARRRTMNRISKRFGEQLNLSVSDDASAFSYYLQRIYNAKSLNSSSLQYPVSISQLDWWNVAQEVIIEPNTGQPPSNFDSDIELEPDRMVCFGVSMEKLSVTQELREQASWKNVLTVQPLTKSIQLHFNGVRKFEKAIDNLIDQHFGRDVSKLYSKNLSHTDKHGDTFHGNDLCYMKTHSLNYFGPGTTCDEEDHTLLLIPEFTKSGFTSFDMREKFSFPFHVEFNVDGQQLFHDFQLPLIFSHQPQRFRLKFVFRPPNYSHLGEKVVISYFTAFCIVPTLPAPTVSASVQVFESITTAADSDDAPHDTKAHRFVKTLVGSVENKAYRNSKTSGSYYGMPRVHCKSVPVEGITINGFKVGYNFVYEVPPKPKCNLDRRMEKVTHIKRREIVKNIKSDLGDF